VEWVKALNQPPDRTHRVFKQNSSPGQLQLGTCGRLLSRYLECGKNEGRATNLRSMRTITSRPSELMPMRVRRT
jgi:hypothetical protein